jgi:D-serine deaminase-like pyridoxal phosphate-dependent protein
MNTPLVVLDWLRLQANIQDMASFAQKQGLMLRPHIKAHKSVGIARLQESFGVTGFTVAKLSEAEEMCKAGFLDITVAFPLIGQEKLHRLVKLLKGGCRVSVIVDSHEGLKGFSSLDYPGGMDVLVEVDSGLARCGLEPGEGLYRFVEAVTRTSGVNFKGVLTHAGHAYAAADLAEVKRIGQHEGQLMVEVANELRRRGIPVDVVSVGSTPTAKFAGEVPGVTEIRPGNYVFYDATQVALGVAEQEQCSLKVIATVVSKPTPARAVIDAGAKVLALDRGAHGSSSIQGHGLLSNPQWRLSRLSEEHGIVEGENLPKIGDIIEIIPNHACPVINLRDSIITEDGILTITMRGCSQ